jgi:hypothetical protein
MSFKAGTLASVGTTCAQEIANLPSYNGHQLFVKPGSAIKATKDCFTWAGCVQLCHDEAEVMDRDIIR